MRPCMSSFFAVRGKKNIIFIMYYCFVEVKMLRRGSAAGNLMYIQVHGQQSTVCP